MLSFFAAPKLLEAVYYDVLMCACTQTDTWTSEHLYEFNDPYTNS